MVIWLFVHPVIGLELYKTPPTIHPLNFALLDYLSKEMLLKLYNLGGGGGGGVPQILLFAPIMVDIQLNVSRVCNRFHKSKSIISTVKKSPIDFSG